jgi:two-component system, cell cycle sensor histidine kinase and response regulator CckA
MSQKPTYEELEKRVKALEAFKHEQQKIKNELMESERRLRNIFETVALIAVMIDKIDNVIFCNDFFLNLTGWKREDVLGKNWFDTFIPEEIRDDMKSNIFNRVLATGEFPEHYENEIITRRGERRLIKWNNAVFFDNAGNVSVFSSIGEDITNRHNAEIELRESEEFLKAIIENIPDMIFVKDAEDLRFVRFNTSGENLLGYSRNELIGKNDYDFFPEDEAEFFTAKDREVLNGLKPIDIPEERIQTRYKGERILHTKKIPILGKEEKPLYLMGISEDITDKKRMEFQLLHARKMDAIATLAGGVAHQFNNALSVLKGNIDLIKIGLIDGDGIISAAVTMDNSVKRMTQLTHQLLAYARGGKYQAKEISLCEFISDTLPLIEHAIKPSITVETDLPQDTMRVEADRTQLQLVLSAILANASEAIEGEGRIWITCRDKKITDGMAKDIQGLYTGDFVSLEIKDDGKGMDEETMDRVFEPFFTTKFQGRGLGMAAVYGIIKNHEGWISISSEPEKGTMVNILLPVI